MYRLAILVDNRPSDGGTVQYNQAIVDALSSLPREKYHIDYYYTNDFWVDYLRIKSGGKIKIQLSQKVKTMLKLAIVARIPHFLIRFCLKLYNKELFFLEIRKYELVIFPSQDILSIILRCPKLGVIHDLMHRYEPKFPEVSGNGRYYYRELLFSRIVTDSKGILVDSKVGKEQLCESYQLDDKRVYSLPYIPATHISHFHRPPADFNERFPLPSNYLFYPAQFWLHKNHNRLIRALSRALEHDPQINIVFAGKKSYEFENLNALVNKLAIQQNVHFVGFVPNEYLGEFYQRARGVIMPTFFGPTNIPPLEAIHFNIPTAVSDIYGMPEQLEDAAIYFDPNSIGAIESAILELWGNDNLRNALKLACSRHRQRWNTEKFNECFEHILQSLLR